MSRLCQIIAMLLLAGVAFAPSAWAQSTGAAAQEAAIRKVLQSQVDAWNRHDLEGFMAGYWNSPTLTFFSGATETQGWQATLERYRKKYQAPDAEMGKLEMTDIRVELLGPQGSFVRGRWHLTLSNGKQPHGLFTLIVREFPEGWALSTTTPANSP
ncbi:MAG TPA: nuclear transport factor 2 family protein [Terriglobales bacterium]